MKEFLVIYWSCQNDDVGQKMLLPFFIIFMWTLHNFNKNLDNSIRTAFRDKYPGKCHVETFRFLELDTEATTNLTCTFRLDTQ